MVLLQLQIYNIFIIRTNFYPSNSILLDRNRYLCAIIVMSDELRAISYE